MIQNVEAAFQLIQNNISEDLYLQIRSCAELIRTELVRTELIRTEPIRTELNAARHCFSVNLGCPRRAYRGADKSLARPGRKQATATKL